ncbi:MAG: hypothetical protein KOO62_04250 [candidate division Zixibacteria bacterium]|nr:hypothetical protein [candidate division Zixibacteria bacterium]
MSNLIRHKALTSAATTASAWLLVLLIVTGWANSSGWIGHRTTAIDEALPTTQDYICNYPPTPGESGTDMTPDGLPTTQGPAYVVLPLLHKTDNTFRRGLPEKFSLSSAHDSIAPRDSFRATPTSIAQVSSHLARQHTLVGAKPSGTG